MLRKLILAVGLLCAAWLPANAQSSNANVVASCGSVTYDQLLSRPLTQDPTGKLCVNATVNATVGGFQPNGAYGTLTATAASSASTALPTGATVRITNLGASAIVSCTFATGAATGLVSNLTIPPLSSVSRVVGTFDHIACIDQTGSTGSNLVVLEGGSGLGNDSGGGGGGSGGGAITAASGAYASGALASGSMVDLGSQADAACGTDNGACSAIALIKRGNQNATTVNTSIGSATPAGTNRIGYDTDDACSNASTKAFLPITATTSLVKVIAPGVAAKKITICQLLLTTTAANNVAVFEATTGTTCATAAVAVYGAGTSVATAANGFPFPANGGVSLGNGRGTVGQTTVNNNDLCIGTSTATPLTGGVVYAVQ